MATNNSNLFTSLFAQFNDVEVLRTYANSILTQVGEAFNERAAEIAKGKKPTPKADAPAVKTKTAKVEKPAPKKEEAPKANTESNGDTLISITDTKAIKKLGLTFEKYNDKCWVLRGDTKPLRKILKENFKGVFNSRLTGGEGWVFRTANAQECANALGLKVKVA